MDTALRWRAPALHLAFSTRGAGDLKDSAARSAWLAAVAPGAAFVVPRQIHGVAVADAADAAALAQADAVVTTDPAIGLGVYGADCPGLVIDTGDALGAAHCGWRGSAAGIVAALLAALAPRSARPPAVWRAVIGPGIAGARYEVDAPVLAARAWPACALRHHRADHALLDLRAVIATDLRAGSVENIRVCPPCTAGDPRLHSYRHDGPGCSQLLAAWRSALA